MRVDRLIQIERTMVPPLNLGPETDPVFARRAIAFWDPDGSGYYGYAEFKDSDGKGTHVQYPGPYQMSSDIPPSFLVPIPDPKK